ncbi:MAG: PilZ domain-containing protein [Pirellulaceae bacterium]
MKALLEKIPDSVQIPSCLEGSEAQPLREHRLADGRRHFSRQQMEGSVVCQIVTQLPAFPRKSLLSKVVTLDISRCGMAYLADQQQLPGEKVILWTLIGKLPCKVVRCRQHSEHCFEIGVEFSK